ncbi:hypothetical protein Ahy_A07g031172 [Arachis hypogaea]|uniref:LRR receptor-like serine/threonine-protein kinase n=1 Tax=Arachis hypogaea TaxID=3818 RepID=A0A445C322_ARAHY|nr:hypothetical protein Ahy_A07g031172 [Arachis hypogaea]
MFDRLTNLQSLRLSYNNFQRKLPSSLFALTQLSSLDCSKNEIEGPLPDKVAFLNLTQLSLQGNLLNGTIPQWALSLKSLRYLDLSNNRFTGHINEITSNSLEYLDLCNNELQGNIPESIFDLVNLSNLCLSPHNWSDTVHFSLFSKLQKLSHLSLSGCNSLVLGSETSVNYTFSNLQALQLRSNNIIGYSTFSGNFSELEFLELSNSKLEGKVPKWIHDNNLVNLTELCLSSDNHGGFVNFSLFSKFQNLSSLTLSGYESISLKSDVNANYTFSNLYMLRLFSNTILDFPKFSGKFHNKLQGKVPKWIHDLNSLYLMNLSTNQLTSIDHFSWHGLQYLDLSSNLMTDEISFHPLQCFYSSI